MRLDELFLQYQRYQILRPASIRNYRNSAESLIRFLGDSPELNAINVDMLLEYRRWILSKCTAVTFNNYRRHLSVLFNFAVKTGTMHKNLFTEVKGAPAPKRRPKIVPISLIQKIIDFLAKSGDKYDGARDQDMQAALSPRWFWLIVVKTLYYTAIRRRQLTELRLADLDFESRMIHLRAEGSKTTREWDIPMPEPLVEDLQYLRSRVIEKIGRYKEDQQLFCYPIFSCRPQRFKSNEMSADQVTNWFKRISTTLEQRVSPHRIRHTTATELTRNTDNMKLVQEILGHTDLRTTFIYVEPEMGSMRHLMGGMTKLVSTL